MERLLGLVEVYAAREITKHRAAKSRKSFSDFLFLVLFPILLAVIILKRYFSERLLMSIPANNKNSINFGV
jgi:hypothetical protein